MSAPGRFFWRAGERGRFARREPPLCERALREAGTCIAKNTIVWEQLQLGPNGQVTVVTRTEGPFSFRAQDRRGMGMLREWTIRGLESPSVSLSSWGEVAFGTEP
jgi:hypothetical protein